MGEIAMMTQETLAMGTVLYIKPEENITTVRERLSATPAQNISLVLFKGTNLKGYVAWKLLKNYARNLQQKISIISADPQICTIARSMDFNVIPADLVEK
jgi:UDP-N-acetylmuramyl tripeptide synthase